MTRKRTGYYKLIDAINTEFRKQGFMSVTYGSDLELMAEIDTQTLFPYCHIIIPTASTQAIMSVITPQIVVMDLVDVQKEYQDTMNEVFDPTNTLDVHQDLLAKSQAALLRVDTYQEVDLIYPYSWIGFKNQYTNLLAGWTFTVGFEVTNADNGIC